MKKYLILALAILIIGGITALLWLRHATKINEQNAETFGLSDKPVTTADNKEYFRLDSLADDLAKFANIAYTDSTRNELDPDSSIGVPPFRFFKRIDCEVIRVDKKYENIIKKTPEVATFHTIVLIKDTRGDLYDFTLTSVVPDKSIVRLQNYGPLTDENPDVVHLPISRRRLTDFPIDFKTRKILGENDGRCIFVPYPFPAGQAFWMFGKDLHNSPIQGLYRNDRFKNVDELVAAIAIAVEEKRD